MPPRPFAADYPTGAPSDAAASLLWGQSFLSHFRSWSIDNQRQMLPCRRQPFLLQPLVRWIPFIAVELDQRAEPLFPGHSPLPCLLGWPARAPGEIQASQKIELVVEDQRLALSIELSAVRMVALGMLKKPP
jgi:hypothetical protein